MSTFLINNSVTKEYIEKNIGKFDPDNFNDFEFNFIIRELIKAGKIDSYMYHKYCGSTAKDSWYIKELQSYYEDCYKYTGAGQLIPFRPSFSKNLISEFASNKVHCIETSDFKREIALINMQLINILGIRVINNHSYHLAPNEYFIYPIELFCCCTSRRPGWRIALHGSIAVPDTLSSWHKKCIQEMYDLKGIIFIGDKLDIRLPKESTKDCSIIFHEIYYNDYDSYYNCDDLVAFRNSKNNTNRLLRETLTAGAILPLDKYNIPTFINDRIAFIPSCNKGEVRLGIVKGATATLVTVEEISTGDVYKCSRGEFVKV